MPGPTRLTKKLIDALPDAVERGGRYFIRDTGVRGLILAVNRDKTKIWKVQRDLYRDGKLIKTVRTTIGTWPDMDVDGARTRAHEVINQIKQGIDPNASAEEPAPESVLTWTVERAYKEYWAHMRKLDRRDVSIDDMEYRLNKYLADWKNRLAVSLTKAECRARHDKITKDIATDARQAGATGKRSANMVMSHLMWVLNYAAVQCEDDEVYPNNPISAVTMHRVRSKGRSLTLDDLPVWWGKVQTLPNPLRRAMHVLGLLSGLRPGTLVAIRREWIKLENRAIRIPGDNMKSDEPFALPLSDYMCGVVRTAMAIGDMLYPGSEWLFPTRSKDGQNVIATQVWKERALPNHTGHILRHTYRTIAETTAIPHSHCRLLINHALDGMDAIYVDKRQLFRDLLASQEIMTARILELCAATPKSASTLEKRTPSLLSPTEPLDTTPA
jgi:integrase